MLLFAREHQLKFQININLFGDELVSIKTCSTTVFLSPNGLAID
jgi:hypothetical protein